jgi:TatD DNase family protein
MVDTHCHLNLVDHFPDPSSTVERAVQGGVDRMIVVGIDDETSQIAVDLADRFDAVYACVGWHPTSAAKYQSIGRIEALCAHPKVVAIGEIGLDYHWDYSTPEQQRVATEAHWELACRLQMPVVFHCREAYDDLIDWLESRDAYPPACVLHCFAGDASHARRALALQQTEVFFGIDGPITFKNAGALREIVAGLPHDRLLLETDAPYLTPHPHRGKPNEPAMIPLICDGLAAALSTSNAEAAAVTTANAFRAFPRLR